MVRRSVNAENCQSYGISSACPHTPVTLNLFQGLSIHLALGFAERWTLKQVQGDDSEVIGYRRKLPF